MKIKRVQCGKQKRGKHKIQNSNDILRPQLLQYNIKGQNCPTKSGLGPEACVSVCVCVCVSVSMHGGPSIAGVTQVHHGPTASASTQPWNTARAQQSFSIQCASSPSSPDTTDVRECSNQGLSLHDLLHNWSN